MGKSPKGYIMTRKKSIPILQTFSGILFFILIGFSGCSSRQFVVSSKDENITKEFRTYASDYDTVWNIVRSTVSEYRFQNDQKEKGLLQTYWKTRAIKEKGRLHAKEDYMHGNVIEDRADDIPQSQMGDFEMKERLSILVDRSTDSTTTVTVAYHFKVASASQGVGPEVERDTAPYANKAYSSWDFYTKEEHKILEKVSEMLKDKKAKKASN